MSNWQTGSNIKWYTSISEIYCSWIWCGLFSKVFHSTSNTGRLYRGPDNDLVEKLLLNMICILKG